MKIKSKLRKIVAPVLMGAALTIGACGKGSPVDVPDPIHITPDREAPNTTIIEHPNAELPSNYPAIFEWSGSDDKTSVEDLVYRFWLEGYQDTTDWTWATKMTYNLPGKNLQEGKYYTFGVQSKDQSGKKDLTPATFKFLVVAPKNDLKFLARYVVSNNSESNDAITLGRNGYLATINMNGLLREFSFTAPTTINLVRSVPTEAKFCSGLAFADNTYYAKRNSTYSDMWMLDGNDPTKVIKKGIANNSVEDMCIGVYNNQKVLCLARGQDLDNVIIASLTPSGQYNEFKPIATLDAPWTGVSGVFYDPRITSLESISLVPGQTTKLHIHDIPTLNIRHSWTIGSQTGIYITGLATKENYVFILGIDNDPVREFIDIYEFAH